MSIEDTTGVTHSDTSIPSETIDQRVERGRATDRAHDGAIVPFPSQFGIAGRLGGNLAKQHERLTFGGYRHTEYRYRNAAGETLQAVLRYDHKEHPDTNEKVIRPILYYGKIIGESSLGSAWIKAPRPLFGLDRLAERPDAPVLVVEGEKTAEAAGKLFPDHVTITWMTGAQNVRNTEMIALAGRSLVLWPDNDPPGRSAMRTFAAFAYEAGAASISMVDVPSEFGAKWDLADDVPAESEHDVATLLANARALPASEVARFASGARRQAEQRRLLGYKPGYSKVSIEHMATALNLLDADMYGNEWRRVARCVFYAFAEAGLSAFDAWSQGSADKYRKGEPATMWTSYASEPAFRADSLAWLFRRAANRKKERTDAGEAVNVALDQNAIALAHIEELSENHAVVERGSKTAVLRERYDPRFKRFTESYLKKADFADQHVHKVLPFRDDEEEDGKKKRPAYKSQGQFWFASALRRSYEDVVFAPGEDFGLRILNAWRGFTVRPTDDPSRWSRFREHLHDHVAGADHASFEYLLNWMAFAVQHLDRPIKTALILIGKKGSGKSIVTQFLGHLFGQHAFVTPRMEDAIGKFNERLETTVLLGLEEAVAPANRGADSALKHLVTSPTIRLEGKFFGVWEAPNHLRIVVTSNHEHVVRADGSNRRYAVFDVVNPHQPDPATRTRYFGEMTEQMETGGYGAMLGQLLRRDVSRWNPEAIPETSALVRQKQLSLRHDPVQSYLFDRLTDGVNITTREDGIGRPIHLWKETEIVEVPVGELNADFKAYCDAHGMTYSECMLSTHLSRYMPEGFKSVVRHERDAIDKTSVRVYPFPPLTVARDRFEEVTRMAIPRDDAT